MTKDALLTLRCFINLKVDFCKVDLALHVISDSWRCFEALKGEKMRLTSQFTPQIIEIFCYIRSKF
jgi:hypothetical protein